MLGHAKVIAALNQAVRLETQGILQYIGHKVMQENFGFPALAADPSFAHARDEMRHLDMFAERLKFLEGQLDFSNPLLPDLGPDVMAQLENDLKGEYTAVQTYADSAKLCKELGDLGTSDLFTTILREEEGHADVIETELSRIKMIGLQNYLMTQIKE